MGILEDTAGSTQRIKVQMIPLFSSWLYRCEDGPVHLNDRIASLTRRLMEDERNATWRTNAGGWHYAHDFFRLDDPVAREIRSHVERHVRAFLDHFRRDRGGPPIPFDLQGWINLNRAGNSNILHCHPGSFLSGTYYVEVPPMKGGEIVFRDPRGPAVAMYETPRIVELPWIGNGKGIPFAPQAGHLIIFPSWLEHRVEPFVGSGDRISLAFNVSNP
jgi:uncharacterized protein (TIGR02466 family)